jgi:hypothetical protein
MVPEQENTDLIDLSDFDSIRISVNVSNQTSNTGVGSNKRSFGEVSDSNSDKSLIIHLIELELDYVVLDVPAKSAAKGHFLKIEFVAEGVTPVIAFTAIGKVKEIENLGDERDRYTITIMNDDAKSYIQALRSVYEKRQKEIEDFFAQVKGA